MASPRFLSLLATALLAFSFSLGVVVVVEGRKVQVMRAMGHYGRWRSPLHGAQLLQYQEEGAGMVSMVMDYSDPKANTNPRTGMPATPEPSSPPAH